MMVVVSAPTNAVPSLPLAPASAVASPEMAPALWVLAAITGLALGATWLLHRIGRARALVAAHRFLPIAYVGMWAVVAALWLRRLIPDEGMHGIARAAALLVIAVAALPWLRNVFHAVVFAIENRYSIGDDLRVDDVEGRLAAIGPRAIVLRASDGTEIAIPHSRLARSSVVRLNLAVRDAPCEIMLAIPQKVAAEDAMPLARAAAALSPYAAPRCAPRVFLVGDENGSAFQIQLRGFVFDREHAQLYRSDVAARFMAMVRQRLEGDAKLGLERAS